MEIIKTGFEGLLVVQPKVFYDDRGYFYEAFRADILVKMGLNVEFVQDNFSKSKQNHFIFLCPYLCLGVFLFYLLS